MEKNYSYQLNANWSNEELATVIKMFQLVEDAYETTALRTDILNQYRAFKQIVNSKSEEKQLGRDFKAESGYELYQVIKTAQTNEHQTIHIVEEY